MHLSVRLTGMGGDIVGGGADCGGVTTKEEEEEDVVGKEVDLRW